MGLNQRSRSRLDEPMTRTVYVPQIVEKTVIEKLPNPDPTNYRIVKSEQIGSFLIVKITYPDCTNFEGNKILVFKNTDIAELLQQKLIDPHFFNNKKYKSPVARFVPTDDGWKMAQVFVRGMKSV